MLVSVHELSKSYGSQTLFSKLNLSFCEKEIVGLTGPNGAGKSTFLRILAGKEPQDEGSVAKRQGIRIAYSTQSPEFSDESLEKILFDECLSYFTKEEASLRAQIFLDKGGFVDGTLLASSLSGGWKKRLDVIRAFISDPDLVLLDEPTNHLDLEGIRWLEKFLQREKKSCVIVSHDRYFLDSVCNRVTEINRCFPKGFFSVSGGWRVFIEKKQEMLRCQKKQERSLSALVKEERAWASTSPKARTTKAKSRLQRGENMQATLGELKERNYQRSVDLDFVGSERQTRSLISAKNLGKTLGGKQLFSGVEVKLSPGTRLGIVGNNGTGKTTLLRILAGEITCDKGTVKYADDLQIVYFDQHREKLDPNFTLKEALSPTGDFINFRGQDIHVNGWAKKFLFSPGRLTLPVHCLSGGEKARILLARLMLKPADVLFLDEPTNDLDVPTLEIIEESLKDFPGAVVLITHDRCFMDQICTQVLGLGDGLEQRLFADYQQWEAELKNVEKEEKKELSQSISVARRKKLSYMEQKELDGMEMAIEEAEKKLAFIEEGVTNKNFNLSSSEVYIQMNEAKEHLDSLYQRWQQLLNKEKNG